MQTNITISRKMPQKAFERCMKDLKSTKTPADERETAKAMIKEYYPLQAYIILDGLENGVVDQ